MPQRAMDGGEANSKVMMVIFMTQFGKTLDFKLGNVKIVMIGVWQNHRKNTKSYDE